MHISRHLTRFSRACGSAFAALLLIAAPAANASFSVDVHPAGAIPDLPDPAGRAGMAAGTVTESDGTQSIIAAGGANFPQAAPGASTPEERGPKAYHQDIFKLRNGQWSKAGTLPAPLGYAAFASVGKGLAVAGGHNAEGILKDALLIKADGSVEKLPPLPVPVTEAAFAAHGNKLFVIGGRDSDQPEAALNTIYMLDTTPDTAKMKWASLPPFPGAGRILSTAAVCDSTLFIAGGCTLSRDAAGETARTYLSDMIGYDMTSNDPAEWGAAGKQQPAGPGTPVAAAAGPAPVRENSIILIGGDKRGNAPDPSKPVVQSRDILVYDVIGNKWTHQGEWPVGIATAPAVVKGSEIMTISGETAPGVRTPVNASASAGYHFEMSTVDYAVLILTVIVMAIIIVSAVRNGVKNVSAVTDPNTRPGLWAWVAVIVLWFVVMLNYFDRQLLSALHEPIVRDIPQTEAQFGMVTSVFLLIYALLSPVGGFLADRYSRRLMILCSLVVWSVVTWWTGHAEDYTSLLIARGAMGISEAFYIPAALALITDYHRGSTRSIATGLHMSGIYVGMAVAGFGATMASWTGWRMTFALFGLIGVAYAIILILFLKDPAKAPADTAQAKKPSEPKEKTVLINVDNDERAIKEPASNLSTGAVLSSLLSGRPMWMLLAVVAFAGAGNWFLLTWYPTLLQDKYQLSSAEAGPAATLWSSVAKYVAVLGGAILADMWYRRNARARALVPGITFTISGPLVVLALLPGIFGWDIAVPLVLMLGLVATQGLAQGSLDATLMPVLRSHIDERYSATGYGLLNLTSAGVGALISFFGGWFKDQGVPLTTTLAAAGCLMLLCGLLLLMLPRPKH
ncbi:MFS transporter [Akkermansia sp.]|uniref:MFS transporter n=1 Tax=Akkermansia sp. TaxID=1872421 RepID=UPI003AB31E96